ncbi:MAG TPA: SO2930 family diheme c-type cytochrome [Kofleriaceae bacterium]|nr:SO2930 family diheme c-type cytochrome [Kofleriaceae bacterium]
MRRAAALALAAALAAGCGDDLAGGPDAGPEDCAPPPGDAPQFDLAGPACRSLSSYRFFADGPAQVPAEGVVPYEVNSALFSDHASKHRFLWLPPGASMRYQAEGAFELPVGSVLIKTFGYLADLRDPSAGERLVETRLLVHGEDGWYGLVYLWDEAQADAHLQVAGAVVPVEWIHKDGEPRALDYLVPNTNQCAQCHVSDQVAEPIGVRARHINRDFAYPDGVDNQLAYLTRAGLLTGAPADPDQAPRAAVWDDPTTGTVAERARAWLDINCAHCHSPGGPARTSGLDLRASQEEPARYGVCKPPVAAGGGSGGRQYGIVPGAPDESILVYRLESVEPDVRMPELLRQTVHEESLALVREWIAAMEGSCGAE